MPFNNIVENSHCLSQYVVHETSRLLVWKLCTESNVFVRHNAAKNSVRKKMHSVQSIIIGYSQLNGWKPMQIMKLRLVIYRFDCVYSKLRSWNFSCSAKSALRMNIESHISIHLFHMRAYLTFLTRSLNLNLTKLFYFNQDAPSMTRTFWPCLSTFAPLTIISVPVVGMKIDHTEWMKNKYKIGSQLSSTYDYLN